MPAPKKVIKPVVRFDHSYYVFENLDQAANAIKFFAKLRRVQWQSNDPESGGHYRPADEDRNSDIELETRFEYREKPKLVGLPAPKRGTVLCTMCESVSVRPGTACGSCGTIAPLL